MHFTQSIATCLALGTLASASHPNSFFKKAKKYVTATVDIPMNLNGSIQLDMLTVGLFSDGNRSLGKELHSLSMSNLSWRSEMYLSLLKRRNLSRSMELAFPTFHLILELAMLACYQSLILPMRQGSFTFGSFLLRVHPPRRLLSGSMEDLVSQFKSRLLYTIICFYESGLKEPGNGSIKGQSCRNEETSRKFTSSKSKKKTVLGSISQLRQSL